MPLFAQERVSRVYTPNDGLPGAYIEHIDQDSQGYIWFSGDGSISRYNGHEFKNYIGGKDLTGKRIFDSYEMPNEELYVIAGSTIDAIKKDGRIRKGVIQNAPPMYEFYPQEDGSVYATSGGNLGLFELKKDTLVRWSQTGKILEEEVYFPNAYLRLSDSLHLVGGQFYSSENKEKHAIYPSLLLLNNKGDTLAYDDKNQSKLVQRLYKDQQDRIWVCGSEGLHLFNPNVTMETSPEDVYLPLPPEFDRSELTDVYIIDMLQDRNGNYWFATKKGLVKVGPKNHFFVYGRKEGLPSSVVIALCEDREGNIWAATSDGAAKISLGGDHFYLTKKDGLYSNFIIDLLLEGNGLLYVSTTKGDKGALQQLELSSGKFKTCIEGSGTYNLIKPGDGKVYLFKEKGKTKQQQLFEFDTQTGRVGNKVFDLKKDWVYKTAIAADGKGHFFAGSTELQVIPLYNEMQYPLKVPSLQGKISHIKFDSQGRLWVGNPYKQLFRLTLSYKDNGTVKVQKVDDFSHLTKEYIIEALYFDQKNTLWIGTKSGDLLHIEKSDRYKEAVVYPSLTVGYGESSQLNEDSNGVIWNTSSTGLYKYIPRQNKTSRKGQATYRSFDFGKANTLSNWVSTPVFQTGNNEYYAGTQNGLLFFKDNQTDTLPPPQVTLTQASVNDSLFYGFGEEKHSLKDHQNNFHFVFSALSFTDEDAVQYSYRLVSSHTKKNAFGWSAPSSQNIVNFANLQPDNYIFEVRALGLNGKWGRPAIVTFSIAPPWYQTWWFALLCILAVALAVYSIFKMRLRSINRRRTNQKLREMDSFKSRFFANISHEFRTPLTLITAPVEKYLSQPNLPTKQKKDLTTINQNVDRLLGLVDQLLDLSKLESGHKKLQVEQGNLYRLMYQLADAFRYQAEQKQIDYSVELEETNVVWFDRDIVEKSIINLLGNAFKYTPKGGSVVFSSERKNGTFELSIENTAFHFSEEKKEQLFNRFHQEDDNADGTGIGLALVKELITLSHGTISVTNAGTDKVRFTLSFPIEEKAYAPEERIEKSTETLPEIKVKRMKGTSVEKTTAAKKPSQKLDEDSRILLVVEDNAELRAYLCDIFSDAFAVIEAQDGEEGWENALKWVPDMVISDVMMPKKTGLELCDDLKTDPRTSHIPIVLLTAKSGEENQNTGLQTGADDYITKPFKTKHLKQKVQNIIATRQRLRERYRQEIVLMPKDLAFSSTDEDFLKEIQTVLEEELTSPKFGPDAFGKELGMSRMQLHRKLKSLTGDSTSAFIRNQRLKLAAKLLKKSDTNIAQVGYAVGFSSPSYFSRSFKKVYGQSPKEFSGR